MITKTRIFETPFGNKELRYVEIQIENQTLICFNQINAAKYLNMPKSSFQHYIKENTPVNYRIETILFEFKDWYPIHHLNNWHEHSRNIRFGCRIRNAENSNVTTIDNSRNSRNSR